ncbi:MAG: SDR family oxidoreductase [Cytophagales bacterium]|nr:MAG: SDR family oxidoreductase [Cytophagales bacterium]
MKKILITGAAGATGKMLYRFLLTKEPESQLLTTDLVPFDESENHTILSFQDTENLHQYLQTHQPQTIYHLVGTFTNIYAIDYESNVQTTQHLLETLLKIDFKGRVLLVGSAAEYGWVKPEDNPIKENQTPQPISNYGLTKTFQSQMMHYYVRLHEMDIVMARTFNILAEKMSEKLLIGRLEKLINEYQQNQIETIVLGNLQSTRDYMPVQEVVEAYWLIMQKAEKGSTINVGSGKPIRIYDLVVQILAQNNISIAALQENKNLIKPNQWDIPEIYADTSQLEALRRK